MATPFVFTPITGINDITQFPDDDPQIRVHLQGLLDQLKNYINGFTGQSVNNFSNNGYQKFPDGLIIQWVNATNLQNNATATLNFPIAFPNNILSVTWQSLFPTVGTNEHNMWINGKNNAWVSIYNASGEIRQGILTVIGY